MFCDLVGSTPLSELLDPEDLRDVIQAYQQTSAAFITRFDGFIAQYLGDGLLVYFGYPTAHENDAQRALLSGLAIIEAMDTLNAQLRQRIRLPRQLQVRIGVHTGLVVVGEVGVGESRQQLALGETTNLAARLQGQAEPDSMVISSVTHRLVEGYFSCEQLGNHTLKGISRSIQIYRVLQKSQAHTRLEAALAAAPTGLTPLVGREGEMDKLLACWQQTLDGQGQVVLLAGEAGIGKSRLIQVLQERVGNQSCLWLDCYCSPYHQNSALYPFVELLQRLVHIKRHDSPERKLEKLEITLLRYNLPPDDFLPLFAAMLLLPLPKKYAPLNLSPQRQKQKTLEALLAILNKLNQLYPLMIVVEDLHWVDPSTLEMLRTLVEQISTTQALALFTFRPAFQSPWKSGAGLTQINLTRLKPTEVKTLARRVAGEKHLPPKLLAQVVERTDGVPIFIEELTKMVVEQNRPETIPNAIAGPQIPATLQALLLARLDRMATARGVAQLGATLGRAFSYELLHAISPLDAATLQKDLRRLVESGLLFQHGTLPDTTYVFKHALIQEAAYQSLLKTDRQAHHRQIAQTLVQQFPDVVETQPALAAHHFTAAKMNVEAVGWWQTAGHQAVQNSANVEAIRNFKKGLALLNNLPESTERTRHQLALKTALGAPLLMVKGYASSDVERNYAQAKELCTRLDKSPRLLPVLYGLWVFYLLRANYQTALELAREFYQLAASLNSPDERLKAYQLLGTTHFYLGELIQAREYLEQGVALYNPEQPRSLEVVYSGADHGVACLSHLALTLWLLGYPAQAEARSRQAINLAKSRSHPYDEAFALFLSAWLHQYLQDGEQTHKLVSAATDICTEQGFALLEAVSTIMGGWAQTELGHFNLGIGQIFDGLAAYRTVGGELGKLHFLALLAEAHGKMGQAEAGLAVLEGALQAVSRQGERFYEAELYRLRGELLMRAESGELQSTSPESYFQKAIAVARQQSARSLELRATLSLSRLWSQQGRSTEAGQALQKIYSTFTEGAETRDLQEARNLLAVLP